MSRWSCYCEECDDFEITKEEGWFEWDLKPLFCPFCSGQIEIYEEDDEVE